MRGMRAAARRAAVLVTACCSIGLALHAHPGALLFAGDDTSTVEAADHRPAFTVEAADEADPAVCRSIGPCTADLLGVEGLAPGGTVTRRVTVIDTGAAGIAALAVRPTGACSQTRTSSRSAADLCAQVHVRIRTGAGTAFDGSAAALGRRIDLPVALTSPSRGGRVVVTAEVSLPRTIGDAYQGLTAHLPLVWSATG